MKMKKIFMLSFVCCLLFIILSACGKRQQDLVNMESTNVDGKRAIVWEGRTYSIFCVVSKRDCGEEIGYVDGDTDDRVSEYKGYSSDEWIVNWLTMDGGAMLMKEQNVVDIPDGLEAEY